MSDPGPEKAHTPNACSTHSAAHCRQLLVPAVCLYFAFSSQISTGHFGILASLSPSIVYWSGGRLFFPSFRCSFCRTRMIAAFHRLARRSSGPKVIGSKSSRPILLPIVGPVDFIITFDSSCCSVYCLDVSLARTRELRRPAFLPFSCTFVIRLLIDINKS